MVVDVHWSSLEDQGLFILIALDHYAREGDVAEGQELRAYQLVESIAHLHGTVSLGSIRFLDNSYFDQYARWAPQRQYESRD